MRRRGMRGDDGWSEHGGYMQAKKTKLEGQFSKETTVTSSLFRGVSIYVNGYTVPPASQLRSLIIQHGGLYQAYYSRATVTHIVTNRLPTMKVNRLTDQKVVRANWITDSIQANKLLPWQQYALYRNRSGGVGQQQLQVIPVQARSTNETSSDEPTPASGSAQGVCDRQLPTDVRSDSDPVVSAENLIALPAPTCVRRVQQMRLDACLSPPKPTSNASGTVTVSSGQATAASKSNKPISLKQLLQTGSNAVSDAIEPPPTAISPDRVVDSCSASPDLHTAPVAGSSSPPSAVESRTDQQLATFYARSRLHHLSSWATELHQLVTRLRANPDHRCDLGEMWKRTVLQEPSPLGTDVYQPVILRLEARLSNHAASSSVSVPPAAPPLPRIVFHIDMDCFFVSVSLRDRPDLKDKPVAVTHANQRDNNEQSTNQRFRRNTVNSMSEIASCSYAARRAGCKNGMLLGRAKQLCPDLETVPYDFDAYKLVSETLYTIVARFTLAIEAVSCDELYADCTELLTLPGSGTEPELGKPRLRDGCWCFEYQLINPLVLGAHLRDLVQKQTRGCTASIGFGTTRLLARLATKRAKPDGQWFLLGRSGSNHATSCASSLIPTGDRHWQWRCVSDPVSCQPAPSSAPPVAACELTGEDARWFSNLPIRELPGIGHVLAKRLSEAFGVHTCGEMMQTVTRNQLIRLLGTKTGARIYDLCHGRDEGGGQLQFVRHSKSVSACMNYGIRLHSHSELDSLVKSLCQELVSRMAQTTCANTPDAGGSRGVTGRCLTVRVFVRAPNAPVESAKFMGHGICNIASRMHSFPEPTADVTLLHRITLSLLRHLCPDPKELRGLGLQMNKLSPSATLPIVRKPVMPKLTVTASEISPQPPEAASIGSSAAVNLKPVPMSSPHSSESATCSDPVGTPQSARRRSLRLKRRGSRRSNTTTSSKTSEDPGSASELVPVNTAAESDPGVPMCASPATPPHLHHHHQDYESPFKDEFRTNEPIDEPPLCSTPRPPIKPSRITATVTAPSRRLVSKPTRGGGGGGGDATSRNRTSNPSKSGSPKKVPTVAESTPGILTQVLSNPTGLFEGKSLDQLKQIFADWITSEPHPLLEDVCILATYLIRLVPFDLDRVRKCLIMLNRLITELQGPGAARASQSDWRYAYRRIGETVSLAVKNCYGDVKLQLQLPRTLE